MSYEIELVKEPERGCGYRKPSSSGVGIYLCCDPLGFSCARMPFPLHRCPSCGGGVKFARAWTWINPRVLFARDQEPLPTCPSVAPHCPMCWPEQSASEREGLLWVGKQHYPSPQDFMREARELGISRKVPAIPKGFKVGENWVYLAHVEADWRLPTEDEDDEGMHPLAGVFMVFRPSRVDLVVDTDHPDGLPDRAKKLKEELGDASRLIKVERQETGQLSLSRPVGGSQPLQLEDK